MPPVVAGTSAIGMLSAALARLENEQMPLAIRGVARETFETLAPEMSGLNRVLLSNLWLFRPARRIAAEDDGERERVAAHDDRAHRRQRRPGRERAARARDGARQLPPAAGRHAATRSSTTSCGRSPTRRSSVERLAPFAEASRVAATDAPGYRAIARTLRELHPDVVVAPALMIGATDSRHFDRVADNVYKFSPVRARPEDLKRFHGTNERISTANYVEMIQFYHQLIGNASADTSQDRSLP